MVGKRRISSMSGQATGAQAGCAGAVGSIKSCSKGYGVGVEATHGRRIIDDDDDDEVYDEANIMEHINKPEFCNQIKTRAAKRNYQATLERQQLLVNKLSSNKLLHNKRNTKQPNQITRNSREQLDESSNTIDDERLFSTSLRETIPKKNKQKCPMTTKRRPTEGYNIPSNQNIQSTHHHQINPDVIINKQELELERQQDTPTPSSKMTQIAAADKCIIAMQPNHIDVVNNDSTNRLANGNGNRVAHQLVGSHLVDDDDDDLDVSNGFSIIIDGDELTGSNNAKISQLIASSPSSCSSTASSSSSGLGNIAKNRCKTRHIVKRTHLTRNKPDQSTNKLVVADTFCRRLRARRKQEDENANLIKINSIATTSESIDLSAKSASTMNYKMVNCDLESISGCSGGSAAKNNKRTVSTRSSLSENRKKVKHHEEDPSTLLNDGCSCNESDDTNSTEPLHQNDIDSKQSTINEVTNQHQTGVDGPPSPSQSPGSKSKQQFRRQHELISLGKNGGDRKKPLCNKHMPWFGIDIGGTLVKVVFFDPKDATNEEEVTLKRIRRYLRSAKPYGATGKRDTHLEMPNVIINKRAGSLHFIRFATSQMPDFLSMAKSKKFADTVNTVCATGGGAYKFEDNIRNNLGITLHKTDELDSIIIGIHYIDKFNSDRECYFLDNPLDDAKCVKVPYNFSQPYPYLVVNIGSGVSILAVYSRDSYSRVSGSSIGGGTFLGLCSLLTQCKTYEEAIRLAKTGSSSKIDKLVKDIYGGDYPKFNLSGDTVASSFGHMNQPEKRKEIKRNDLARALLEMITINIGSIARMCAASEEIDRVVFIGNFLRVNQLSMRLLSYAVNYWSKGAMKALFLEHEGYFGAVGCFVESTQGCLGFN